MSSNEEVKINEDNLENETEKVVENEEKVSESKEENESKEKQEETNDNKLKNLKVDINLDDEKLQELIGKKAKELIDEEMKKSKMTVNDLKVYEDEKRFKDLEERENALNHKALMFETKDILEKESLPLSAAKFLIARDKESTLENIESFKTFYNEAVQEGVKKQIKGKSPALGSDSNPKPESSGLSKLLEENQAKRR